MALVAKDRVKETTTTTGAGTLTLAGAVAAFQAFSAIGDGNTCRYVLLDANGTAWETGIGTYTASGTTLARTTVLASSNSNNALNLSAGTHTVFCDFPAVDGIGAVSAAQAITPGGRLTLESGVPVSSSDQTAKTNIYYTPYIHNVINLWNGALWQPIVFSEYTLALGTLTSGKPYDVFAYLNSGALALEALVWTDDTTRATAVTLQDGRHCKSGDKTRLYLGTFYTTSTTTTEDSEVNRYVYNRYNRTYRSLKKNDTTSHSYSTGALREWNNSTTATRTNFLDGIGDSHLCASGYLRGTATSSTIGYLSLGLNSTTTSINGLAAGSSPLSAQVFFVSASARPRMGQNFLTVLEYGDPATTYTHAGIENSTVSV